MSPHEPPLNDYERISELILNLDVNNEEEEYEDLLPYQIVGVDMKGKSVPFPEFPRNLEQLPIPIIQKPDVSINAK